MVRNAISKHLHKILCRATIYIVFNLMYISCDEFESYEEMCRIFLVSYCSRIKLHINTVRNYSRQEIQF